MKRRRQRKRVKIKKKEKKKRDAKQCRRRFKTKRKDKCKSDERKGKLLCQRFNQFCLSDVCRAKEKKKSHLTISCSFSFSSSFPSTSPLIFDPFPPLPSFFFSASPFAIHSHGYFNLTFKRKIKRKNYFLFCGRKRRRDLPQNTKISQIC